MKINKKFNKNGFRSKIMISKFNPIIEKMYDLFEEIEFPECHECSECCYLPWILKEEYNSHLENFGKTMKEINSVAFIMDTESCRYAKENRCTLYEDRPLDCRLFPLDIIKEDEKYWWVIFTICPQHEIIRDKLIPLIPKLESMISKDIFEQYKNQITLTKKMYLPYKLKKYEKIKKFQKNY
ncbi:hypothetical protein COU58_01205 [Candidatus Pacearchaeota archaeon CG10_big_fil_rev_8_21_14_0_10_32_42]|nr:MAG: hypothetical protein COU58_01205 [Candidatus Pacearchaeota archaeon CG10_big_fil_rev_8_21_14_0_10_32_42]